MKIKPIRVSIVEDDSRLREAIATLLEISHVFACASKHRSAEDALAHASSEAPDVFLVDIQLPGLSGVEFVRLFKPRNPNCLIIMLTIAEDADPITDSFAAGASGYILKGDSPAGIFDGIQEVMDGGTPMSRSVARKVRGRFISTESSARELQTLTNREDQVLANLSQGLSHKEIADSLGIGVETVHSHVRAILAKLHVNSSTAAVAKYAWAHPSGPPRRFKPVAPTDGRKK